MVSVLLALWEGSVVAADLGPTQAIPWEEPTVLGGEELGSMGRRNRQWPTRPGVQASIRGRTDLRRPCPPLRLSGGGKSHWVTAGPEATLVASAGCGGRRVPDVPGPLPLCPPEPACLPLPAHRGAPALLRPQALSLPFQDSGPNKVSRCPRSLASPGWAGPQPQRSACGARPCFVH